MRYFCVFTYALILNPCVGIGMCIRIPLLKNWKKKELTVNRENVKHAIAI